MMKKVVLLLLCGFTIPSVGMNSSRAPSNNPPLTSSQLIDLEILQIIQSVHEQRARQNPRQLVMKLPRDISPSVSLEDHLAGDPNSIICGIPFCNIWRIINNHIH
jgi:hypothetical protein